MISTRCQIHYMKLLEANLRALLHHFMGIWLQNGLCTTQTIHRSDRLVTHDLPAQPMVTILYCQLMV